MSKAIFAAIVAAAFLFVAYMATMSHQPAKSHRRVAVSATDG